jgi:hypothetical protein
VKGHENPEKGMAWELLKTQEQANGSLVQAGLKAAKKGVFRRSGA